MPNPTRERVEKIRKTRRPWCGDNSCRFGVPKNSGMATNSGCRCIERSLTQEQRLIVERAKAVDELLDYINHLHDLVEHLMVGHSACRGSCDRYREVQAARRGR